MDRRARHHFGEVDQGNQGRADWGVAIESVARQHELGFLPVQDEQYDFVVPKSRRERPAVRRFVEILQDPAVRAALTALGFKPS